MKMTSQAYVILSSWDFLEVPDLYDNGSVVKDCYRGKKTLDRLLIVFLIVLSYALGSYSQLEDPKKIKDLSLSIVFIGGLTIIALAFWWWSSRPDKYCRDLDRLACALGGSWSRIMREVARGGNLKTQAREMLNFQACSVINLQKKHPHGDEAEKVRLAFGKSFNVFREFGLIEDKNWDRYFEGAQAVARAEKER